MGSEMCIRDREKTTNIAGQEMRAGRAGIVGAWLAEHLSDYDRVADLVSYAEANKWDRWPFTEELARLNLVAQQGGAPNALPAK